MPKHGYTVTLVAYTQLLAICTKIRIIRSENLFDLYDFNRGFQNP